MTLKKFGIFTCIIVSIILALIVSFDIIKPDSNLVFEEPETFVVFAKKSTGVDVNSGTEKFDRLKKEVNNMAKFSILSHLSNGVSINTVPSQDIENVYPSWSAGNQTSNYCLQIRYNEIKTMIVNIDGDTRAIDYRYLTFIVNPENKVSEVAIYFSTSSTTTYKNNPILVLANQSSLYKTMVEIAG